MEMMGYATMLLFFFLSFLSFSASSSNIAVGINFASGSNCIVEADYDAMTIKPLFDVEFLYTSDFGSAYDQVHNIIFLTAETANNSNPNAFGFFSVNVNTSTVKQHTLPDEISAFQTSMRWLSSTPDVVYIFSWKAAFTYNFAEDSFQEFLNFSTVFSAIPSNAQSPSPFYFDTNANILYAYFVYDNQNNQVQIARIGVTMDGSIVDKQTVNCVPGFIPYFDPKTNSTYSILSIANLSGGYDYVQSTTQQGTCVQSKTIWSDPTPADSYLWDAPNNRMLLGYSNFAPEICKYTNNEWTLTCNSTIYLLEAIFPSTLQNY